ncbi:MAG: glycosyltransferase [Fuerstiella sp.]|nr:glycosyltransferase [Fuerstiella sp.]
MVLTESPSGSAAESSSAQFCASVVVPVFNCAKELRRLLALLETQTTASSQFEIIVCDDGSTESCRPVVADFQRSLPYLRCLRQENRGAAAARNMGILHAKSNIVVFLDTNAEPDRHLIARLTTALSENPDWHGAKPRLLSTRPANTTTVELIQPSRSGCSDTTAIAYRTNILRRLGGLDENFPGAGYEGLELAVRVLQQGPIGLVPGAIVHQQPPSPTVLSCWQARKHWRFLRILASRHGCLTRPNRPIRFPRLQTVVAAAVLQPFRRVKLALRLMGRSPADGVHSVCLSVIDCVGAVTMIPAILFGATPPRLSSVAPGDVSKTVALVARAS